MGSSANSWQRARAYNTVQSCGSLVHDYSYIPTVGLFVIVMLWGGFGNKLVSIVRAFSYESTCTDVYIHHNYNLRFLLE